MWLTRLSSFFAKISNPVSRTMGGIGAVVLAGMMFLAAMDVFLRYFFNRPISGAMELVQYMMLVTIVSGFALCTMDRSHVRVEVFIDRFPLKVRKVLNCITSLLSLGLMVLISRQAVVYAGLLQDSRLTSPVLFIPAYPFALLMALAMAVFSLALLWEFFHFLSKAVNE
jgi:TRAP-type C4-dicarboxylate transport system permease small subunit